jgi:hypothetical protein
VLANIHIFNIYYMHNVPYVHGLCHFRSSARNFIFCRAAVQRGLGRSIVEVSRSPAIRHARTHARTHALTNTPANARAKGLIWRSDRLVGEAATYTRHNKHNRWTSMPSKWLEPAIPAIHWRTGDSGLYYQYKQRLHSSLGRSGHLWSPLSLLSHGFINFPKI